MWRNPEIPCAYFTKWAPSRSGCASCSKLRYVRRIRWGHLNGLSNLVIGASLTAPMAPDAKRVVIDPDEAPAYVRLHATRQISPHEIIGSIEARLP